MSKTKTLCDWDKKHIEKKFDDLIRLVDHPNYICQKCARSANSKENLCSPLKIKHSRSSTRK